MLADHSITPLAPASDEMVALNDCFRSHYDVACRCAVEAASPIVIARNDFLQMMRLGEWRQGSLVDRKYHDLKAIAHIPLAIHSVLRFNREDLSLSREQKEALVELQERIEPVATDLRRWFDEEVVRARQQLLISRSLEYLATLLQRPQYCDIEYRNLVDQLRVPLLANVREAAAIRLDNYHRQMLAWRAELPSDEWRALRVVVPGAVMSRDNHLSVQYFSRLLGERGEGDRIIYAENCKDPREEVRRLGVHLLDTQVGRDFFGDPWRMQRDLLGSAAQGCLDAMDFTFDDA